MDDDSDSKQRFSSRVEDYVKYRPGYPDAVVEFLRDTGAPGRGPGVVADVGSGTGISAELFLRHGYEVYAVEPNAAMRRPAEQWLGGRADYAGRFRSVAGAAEATTLPAASVDLVAAGQAFHWFDPPAARAEFARILRPGGAGPGGRVALVWNDRRLRGVPFLEAYEALLLRFSTDYARVRHDNVGEEDLRRFFGPRGFEAGAFYNEQVLDEAGLRGRVLSSSYTAPYADPRHGAMLEELRRVFDQHQRDGRVTIEYDTRVYVGRLT